MSYDPTLPAPNAPLVSAIMRAQLQGLKAFIDAQAELISEQSAALSALSGQMATLQSTVAAQQAQLSSQSAELANLSAQQTDTATQLASAQAQISTLGGELTQTARNPAGLSPFTAFFSDPLTSGDGNTLQANLNALLAAVQRM